MENFKFRKSFGLSTKNTSRFFFHFISVSPLVVWTVEVCSSSSYIIPVKPWEPTGKVYKSTRRNQDAQGYNELKTLIFKNCLNI